MADQNATSFIRQPGGPQLMNLVVQNRVRADQPLTEINFDAARGTHLDEAHLEVLVCPPNAYSRRIRCGRTPQCPACDRRVQAYQFLRNGARYVTARPGVADGGFLAIT